MKGFTYNFAERNQLPKDKNNPYETGLALLARNGNVEIIRQQILKESAVWLIPGDNPSDMEFFFVHSGKLEMEIDGRTLLFEAGDSFTLRGIEKEVNVKALADTELLYVSTAAVYAGQEDFQNSLKKIVGQINDKDNYTFRHSRNVMKYTMKLYDALKDRCENITISDMVMASLFHDIGKVRIPDEVLKKKGRFTAEEYETMKAHSAYGAEILRSYFEKTVCDLVRMHHESLDGKGYPDGLAGDEIPFAARIITAADSFDAMTSKREYNVKKGYIEAAQELVSMPYRYDSVVTAKLLELVQSGEFGLEQKDEREPEK